MALKWKCLFWHEFWLKTKLAFELGFFPDKLIVVHWSKSFPSRCFPAATPAKGLTVRLATCHGRGFCPSLDGRGVKGPEEFLHLAEVVRDARLVGWEGAEEQG